MPSLAPVIEDYILIRDGNASGDQVTQGTGNLRRLHVPAGIIVPAHNTDARMVALSFQHKIVQELEIIVVVRDENTVFTNGVTKVNGILRPANAKVSRNQNVVSIAAKELYQHRKNGVVVQIKPHCRKILA
jgi:hypothetical protein